MWPRLSIVNGQLSMVIVFTGIPGCGKTTIATKLSKRLEKLGTVKLFISDKLKPPVYKKFFNLLVENLSRCDFLIFDGTFFKRKWREEMRRLARNSGSPRKHAKDIKSRKNAKEEEIVLVYIRCSVETAIERNHARKADIPDQAVYTIANQFEEPEHPDVIIDTEKVSAEEAVEKIFDFVKKENI